MHADWMLWAALSVVSLALTSGWGLLFWYGTRQQNLVTLCERAVQHLPLPIQERIQRIAQRQNAQYQSGGYSAGRWLHRLIMQLLFISPALLLPLPLMYKLALLSLLLIRWLVTEQRRRRYMHLVLSQWPSTLDMLSMLLQSGLSLPAALHALHSVPSNLASISELAQLHRLQQGGATIAEALGVLCQRIPHSWINVFAGAVLQAQQTGGALAHTLRNQADQCRQQQLLAAEKRAQEVSVKLMLPLIFCFFPVTMLLILGPILIRFSIGGEW